MIILDRQLFLVCGGLWGIQLACLIARAMVGEAVRYTYRALDDSDDDRYLALQREMDKAWREQS